MLLGAPKLIVVTISSVFCFSWSQPLGLQNRDPSLHMCSYLLPTQTVKTNQFVQLDKQSLMVSRIGGGGTMFKIPPLS